MSFAKIAKLIANSLPEWKILINFGESNLDNPSLHTVQGDSYCLDGQVFIILFGGVCPNA